MNIVARLKKLERAVEPKAAAPARISQECLRLLVQTMDEIGEHDAAARLRQGIEDSGKRAVVECRRTIGKAG